MKTREDGLLVTDRGFRIFANDEGFRIQESSVAFEGAHCWIIHLAGEASVQLSVAQAKVAIDGLQRFVTEAEGDRLTEPARR